MLRTPQGWRRKSEPLGFVAMHYPLPSVFVNEVHMQIINFYQRYHARQERSQLLHRKILLL